MLQRPFFPPPADGSTILIIVYTTSLNQVVSVVESIECATIIKGHVGNSWSVDISQCLIVEQMALVLFYWRSELTPKLRMNCRLDMLRSK